MNGFGWERPAALWALLLVPLLAGLFGYARAARRRARARWGENRGPWSVARGPKAGLVLAACVCAVMAWAGPVFERKAGPPAGGQDTVILLDVSRSMLADGRLEGAKVAVRTWLLHREGRAGLALFAGTPLLVCPLTSDRSFFGMILERAEPEELESGGTELGTAMRWAVDNAFDDVAGRRTLAVITDGEDHGRGAIEAAEYARRQGVRLVMLGAGEEGRAGLVPSVTWQGKEVWSKPDFRLLAGAAMKGSGAFGRVGEMERVLGQPVSERAGGESGPWWRIGLVLAVALLAGEALWR